MVLLWPSWERDEQDMWNTGSKGQKMKKSLTLFLDKLNYPLLRVVLIVESNAIFWII